jgi:probable rRNA maturation factor
MKLHLINFTGYKISIKSFEKIVENVLRSEKIKKDFSLNLVLMGEKGIKKINKRYAGKNQVTTVLSFPFSEIKKPTKKDLQFTPLDNEKNLTGFIEPQKEENLIGEILLCPSRIKKLANRQKKDFKELLDFFFLHGFLHLLGYNHTKTDDTKQMRKKEKEILSNF